MDRLITHLRHVDLAVPDYDRQLAFYTDLWGSRPRPPTPASRSWPPRARPSSTVRLRADAEKRLDLISFGAATAADVDALAERLGRAGVTLVERARQLETPGGGYGLRFFDLDGRTVEVSSDVALRAHRKIEEGESIPVRLSHVVLNSPDPDAPVALVRPAPRLQAVRHAVRPHMGDMMYFMRCNPRHHSLAIARGPHVSLHHVSFELRGIDEYMRGTGRVLRAGVEKVWGPGRHLAGNNTFSYFLDPQGNTIEYTTELECLDEDAWHPHIYDFTDPMVPDQWGTANPMSEIVAKKSFNDPDRGVFVAPPV